MTYLVTLVPVLCLKPIYSAIGQDPEIASLACQYIWTIAPAILPYIQAVAIIEYSQSQGYTTANIVVLSSATLTHIILILVFVTWLDMGYSGVCLATSLGFCSRFLFAYLYTCTVKPFQETRDLPLLSRESFT